MSERAILERYPTGRTKPGSILPVIRASVHSQPRRQEAESRPRSEPYFSHDFGRVSVHARETANRRAIRAHIGPPETMATTQATKQNTESGTPGTVAQSGGAGGGGGSVTTSTTCQPNGLDRAAFLATSGTTTNDFGLTTLDTSAVTYPNVITNPAKPRGVAVAQTTSALPSIPSVFTKAGTFIEGNVIVVGGDGRSCPSGKYPIKWIITSDGAQKISDGEQEHCNDFQFAFDISLKLYADAVNALAVSGHVFPSQRAVEIALTRTTGVAPGDWQNVFVCLVQKTLLRDPRRQGGPSWHTPRPTFLTPNFPDCKEERAWITAASLPEVGKHSSAEIIKGCGEKQAPPTRPGER